MIAAVATGFDSLYPDSPRSKQLKNMTLAAIAAERAAQKEKPEIEASTANFLDIELYDLRGRKKVLSDLSMLVKSFF